MTGYRWHDALKILRVPLIVAGLIPICLRYSARAYYYVTTALTAPCSEEDEPVVCLSLPKLTFAEIDSVISIYCTVCIVLLLIDRGESNSNMVVALTTLGSPMHCAPTDHLDQSMLTRT